MKPAWRHAQLLRLTHHNLRTASSSAGGPSLQVFNDRVKQLQRERSAANADASRKVDYLRDEVASRLCERLLVCQIHPWKQSDLNICRISNDTSLAFSTSVPMHATLLARSPSLLMPPRHRCTVGYHILPPQTHRLVSSSEMPTLSSTPSSHHMIV